MAAAPRWRAEERRSAPRRTVRGKLVLLVAASVMAAVALVSILSAWRDAGRDAALQADRLHAAATAASAASAQAVAQGDPVVGAQVLRDVSRMPGVASATLERRDGGALARVIAPKQVGGRVIQVSAPIAYAGRPVGRVLLAGRSEGVLDRILAGLAVSLAAALLALGLGLVAAWRMQQAMMDPIVALTRAMERVQRERRFEGAVAIGGDGEIGDLIHGFNRMQDEIRDRDVLIAGRLAELEHDTAVAREATEAAERGRSDVFTAVAQEIRAPMSGVAGLAERLAAGEPAARRRRLTEVIAKSGASLLATIDDILELSGSGAGASELALELVGQPVDLAELVEEVCLLFWDQAVAKGLDLAAYVDPATPAQVMADPVRLRQVIAALVNTAVRSTDVGGVLVEVEPDEANGVQISVHDTGAGIAKDRIEEVFGGSSTADPASARKARGAGPGLVICKRLVEAMGGRFLVNTEVGRGSTFVVRLPVAALAIGPTWPTAPKTGARAQLAVQGLASRRALSRYLGRAGFTVASGAGEQTLLRVADTASLQHIAIDAIPTICLAAHDDPAARALVREGKAQAVLAQPFRRDDLAVMLHRIQAEGTLGDPWAEVRGEADALSLSEEPGDVLGEALSLQVQQRLIDPQVAAQLDAIAAGGRAEFVSRVYSLYRENAPDSVLKLMEAAARLDAAGCAKAAHALKSMSFNIGAAAVANLSGDIEAAAREGSTPSGITLAELQNLLAATLTRLNGGMATEVRAEHGLSIPSADAELLADMKKGLAEDQMSLVYQPQVDRDGERVIGVEALIRWTHPTRGPISPGVFIPIAERYGLIPHITDWVVERLVAETRYLTGLQIAFNVSAIEFSEPGFVERLLGLVERNGYDPRRLEVEITETAILQNETAVRRNIDRLRATGMRIALDDFGAGYSSLGHLRRYPFDKLKIDREFITDCSRDMQAATVVHAVVSIGRALGMKVIAEGVETDTQRKFLKVAGVHAMQGYLFGKPVSIDELAFSLQRNPHRERA